MCHYLLAQMQRGGLTPKTISCSIAFSADEEAKRPGDALEFLPDMRQIGMEPDVVTRNAAISEELDVE